MALCCGSAGFLSPGPRATTRTATTIQVCADALTRTSALFDAGSPEQAVDQAHTALATTLREVTVDDVITRPAQWLELKAQQVATLTSACAG